MTVDLLIFLLAFAVPGALAVEAWDFGCMRKDRTVGSLLGHGVVISMLAYTLLQAVGLIDLSVLLVHDTAGATPAEGLFLSLNELLSTRSLVTFMGLCAILGATGGLSGHFVHPWIGRKLGRSLYPSVWSEFVSILSDADRTGSAPLDSSQREATWIHIRTKSGWEWCGRPHIMPAEPGTEDCIVLKQVKCLVEGSWVDQSYAVIAIPMADIEYIQANYPGGPQNEQTKTAGSISSGEGQQTRRRELWSRPKIISSFN